MKYFKLFLMWIGFVIISSMFGEYVVSREVNGFLQLLSFIGLVGVFMYLVGETVNKLTNKKEKK